MTTKDEETGETSKLIQTKDKEDRRALVGLGVVVGLALVTAASVFIGAAGGGSKVTSLGSKVASLGISASPKFIPVLKGGFVPPLHKHLYNDKVSVKKAPFKDGGPNCPIGYWYDRSGTYTTTEKACEKGNNEEIKPLGITGSCDDGWHRSTEFDIETPACVDKCPKNYKTAGGQDHATGEMHGYTCEMSSEYLKGLLKMLSHIPGGYDNTHLFGYGAQCTCTHGKAARPKGIEIVDGIIVGIGIPLSGGVAVCELDGEQCAKCDDGYTMSYVGKKTGLMGSYEHAGCCPEGEHLEIDDGFDLFDNYKKRKCVGNVCTCKFGNAVESKDCLVHKSNTCKECCTCSSGVLPTESCAPGCVSTYHLPEKGQCPCNIQSSGPHNSCDLYKDDDK